MEVEAKKFSCCPFCGGTPRYMEQKTGFWTERVICDKCSFYLPPIAWEQRYGPGKILTDTDRIDWMEKNQDKLYAIGKFWYWRSNYGKPLRRSANLRQAIDTASEQSCQLK
jgi:ribosomal protein L37AE/L43A